MNAGRSALGLWALGIVLLSATAARATGAAEATHLSVSASSTIVSGRQVAVHVRLTDRAGKPIAGATIRLVTTTTFLGAERTEIIDEGKTGSTGKVVLAFAPVEAGTTVVTATYEGDGAHAGAKSSTTFDVREAVAPYHSTPVGLQAPWARSYLILVPFLGVWITYLVVVAQIRKVRRAGVRAPIA